MNERGCEDLCGWERAARPSFGVDILCGSRSLMPPAAQIGRPATPTCQELVSLPLELSSPAGRRIDRTAIRIQRRKSAPRSTTGSQGPGPGTRQRTRCEPIGSSKLGQLREISESRGPDADLGTTKAPLRGPFGTLTRCFTVGLHRIELWTSSLSGMRSNRLSYSPRLLGTAGYRAGRANLNRDDDWNRLNLDRTGPTHGTHRGRPDRGVGERCCWCADCDDAGTNCAVLDPAR